MASLPPHGGNFRTISSDPKNPSAPDHPLAVNQPRVDQPPNDVELASRPSESTLSYSANVLDSALPAPRAPFQFPPPPSATTLPPPPAPSVSLGKPSTGSNIPPPFESLTRTLDEFVDYFLLTAEENSASASPAKLHPDPLPSDMPDIERLSILMSQRSYADVVILTHRLLSGPNSHYAPIWQGLLHGETSSLALESQQQELLQIILCHMEALVKLKRYNELHKEIASWTFAHSNKQSGDQHVCPDWVPWSIHIAIATCLFYKSDEASSPNNQPLDALYNIRADIPDNDFLSRLRVDQMISNLCVRRKQWRMALASLQHILDVLPSACRQHVTSSGNEHDDQHVQTLVAAYSCELLSRQGRILLQAGATANAATMFQQAAASWNLQDGSGALAERYTAVAMASANLAMNEGLVEFANSQHELALECFRRASEQVKPLCQKESPRRMDSWSIEDAMMPESPHLFYSNCLNNMALCAIYTCRLHEAIHLMESLIRENPSAFLTERVALNLCTLYELQCDSAVAARKKRVLQLLAKRFSLQDIGAECFRLQQ